MSAEGNTRWPAGYIERCLTNLMFIGPCIIAIVDEWRTTWCHFLFYFTYYVLNMFRTLIFPSSGACDCVDELPHRSSCSQFVMCWSFCCGWYLVVFVLQAEACWAHNKWNKIASDIKLVFNSSNILKTWPLSQQTSRSEFEVNIQP